MIVRRASFPLLPACQNNEKGKKMGEKRGVIEAAEAAAAGGTGLGSNTASSLGHQLRLGRRALGFALKDLLT